MNETLTLMCEDIRKVIDDVADDIPSRKLFESWLESCPFEYEFSDETEGSHTGEVCQWYFFRIPGDKE